MRRRSNAPSLQPRASRRRSWPTRSACRRAGTCVKSRWRPRSLRGTVHSGGCRRARSGHRGGVAATPRLRAPVFRHVRRRPEGLRVGDPDGPTMRQGGRGRLGRDRSGPDLHRRRGPWPRPGTGRGVPHRFKEQGQVDLAVGAGTLLVHSYVLEGRLDEADRLLSVLVEEGMAPIQITWTGPQSRMLLLQGRDQRHWRSSASGWSRSVPLPRFRTGSTCSTTSKCWSPMT